MRTTVLKTNNRVISYYKIYLVFIKEYPLFRYTSISYDVYRRIIPKIRKWFHSNECRSITDVDLFVITPDYWKDLSRIPSREELIGMEIDEPSESLGGYSFSEDNNSKIAKSK